MNRPANILNVNTEIRNLASSCATAMANEGNTPQVIRVELRQYNDKGTLTYRWDSDVLTGKLTTECVSRTLNEEDYTLSEEVQVSINVPVRHSTQMNLIHIAETPMKKQYKWIRPVGLLVSCAWRVWNDSSEVIVSFIHSGRVERAVTFDGIDVMAE